MTAVCQRRRNSVLWNFLEEILSANNAPGNAYITGDLANFSTSSMFDAIPLKADGSDIFVTKIGLPPVSLEVAGSQIILSWTTNVARLVLESTTNLAGT